MRQYRSDAVKGAGQIDRNHPVPIFRTHLADHAPRGRAGPIDEDVDAAPSLGYGLGQSGKSIPIGDIEPVGRGMTVAAGDLGGDPFSRGRIAIENPDLRTGCGKGAGGRRPDPIAAASDKGDLSGKIFHHLFYSAVAVRRAAL